MYLDGNMGLKHEYLFTCNEVVEMHFRSLKALLCRDEHAHVDRKVAGCSVNNVPRSFVLQPLALSTSGEVPFVPKSSEEQNSVQNEAKSVAGNHWLRLSPTVALLRGQVWSSLGIRCQQQQLGDK